MDNLSFAHRHDHEPVSFTEDDANKPTGARHKTPIAPSAYRAASVLDSLSAYAAVLGCSGDCGAPAV